MTIAKRPPLFIHGLLLAGVISLAACGGGGGGSKKPVIDTTPNAIAFVAASNAEPNTSVTSSPVTISGINAETPISIVGGEYSLNGGAFTAAPGTVTNGQTLSVRIVSADTTNTLKEAVVNVGGVTAKFTVTTLVDVTPDVFTFVPKNDVQLNTEQISEAITVSGIDVAVPVSVVGGLYSIDGGEFTSAAGTVSPGQTVTVKTTAAAKTETAQEAVLTIGGVTGSFIVTTIPDTTPPVAEFKFPTPYTMSEADEVKVRGIATDDHAITEVKLVVRSYNLGAKDTTLNETEIVAVPASETDGVKDFSSWTATIPLIANAENEIKVVATDARNNSIAVDAANKVVIRQANGLAAFPNESNPFTDVSGGMVHDNLGGRDRLLVADAGAGKIYSIALDTGSREVFKDLDSDGIPPVWGMVIDNSFDEPVLYAKEYSKPNLLKINLASAEIINSYSSDLYQESHALIIDEINGVKTLISVNQGELGRDSNVISFDLQAESFSIFSSDANHPLLPANRGLVLDKARNRYLVTVRQINKNLYGVYSIDKSTGERKAFSTNDVGSGELFVDRTALQEIALDEERNLLYTPDYLTGKLFSIDLITGDRKVLTDLTYKDANGEPLRIRLTSIHADIANQYAFISDSERNSLLVVDLTTGERVVLSKPKNVF